MVCINIWLLRIFWSMKLTNEVLYRKARTVPVNEQIRKRRCRLIVHKQIHQTTPESYLLGHQKADEKGEDHALRGVELSNQRETS